LTPKAALDELLHSIAPRFARRRGDDFDGDGRRNLDEPALWRTRPTSEKDGQVGHPSAIGAHGELCPRARDERSTRRTPVAQQATQPHDDELVKVLGHLFLHA
jgi:hypothetical protein